MLTSRHGVQATALVGSLCLGTVLLMGADKPVKHRMVEPNYYTLGFFDSWLRYIDCDMADPNGNWACANAHREYRLRIVDWLRSAGFNTIYTVLAPLPNDPDVSQEFLDAAWNGGVSPVQAVPWLVLAEEVCLGPGDIDPGDPQWSPWQVTSYRCHPGLLGWWLYEDVDRFDPYRCDPNDPNYVVDPNFCYCPEKVISRYNGFHAPDGEWGPLYYHDPADPNCPGAVPKPIFNCGGWGNRIRHYLDGTDVFLAQDFAFLPGGTQLDRVDSRLSQDMENACPSEDPNECRPVVAVLQTYRFAWCDPNDPNSPDQQGLPDPNDPQITIRQIRNMTYQALLNGVAGIGYYIFNEYDPICEHTYFDLEADTPAMAAHRAHYVDLAQQIDTLRPVLLSGKLVKIDPGNPKIRASYWLHDPGDPTDPNRLYVVAVNVSDTPAEADIPLPIAKGDNYLYRLFDTADPNDPSLYIPPPDDVTQPPHLRGTMAPESTHVYRCHMPIVRPADMNCDGLVTTSDYATFVQHMTDPATWRIMYPECSILNGDINGDGVWSVGDIKHGQPGDYYPLLALLAQGNALPPVCPADMSCDAVVDLNDISPFVQAVSNPVAWVASHGDCTMLNGDINGDGVCRFDDIDAFTSFVIEHTPSDCAR